MDVPRRDQYSLSLTLVLSVVRDPGGARDGRLDDAKFGRVAARRRSLLYDKFVVRGPRVRAGTVGARVIANLVTVTAVTTPVRRA